MDLLHCSALSPHADVEQLSTTVAPTLLQSYKSPTVRPGPSGTAAAGDGQERPRGREAGDEMDGGGDAAGADGRRHEPGSAACAHLHLWPHKISR